MATITITSASDTVDGDVSSVAALNAFAGSDGISLREALLAVNATPGAHTVTFAPSLSGHTIQITSALPAITQPHLTLQGPESSGQPAVTLDFSGVPPNAGVILLSVQASEVTISGLGFQGIHSRQVPIFVRADSGLGAPLVERVTIRDCSFEPLPGNEAYAVRIGTDASLNSVDAIVRDVHVENNTFNHFRGDVTVIHIQGSGTNCLIEGTVIQRNVIDDSTFPVELVIYQAQGSRIQDTLIIGNAFNDNFQTISLFGGSGSLSGVIADTVISQNEIRRSENPAIHINAGGDGASGNQFVSTTIVNNLFVGEDPNHYGGISIVGNEGSGTNNAVIDVLITNNTIVRAGSSGQVTVISNQAPGTGNSVAGVLIQNTIFYGEGNDFGGDISEISVVNTLLSDHHLNFNGMAVAGVNGNIVGNPLFLDAANGDYRLRSGSPAIDSGLSDGAPSTDILGSGRTDELNTLGDSIVDMGAFEFAGGAGDDVLDFGTGVQTMTYAGPRSSYDISHDGAKITVNGPDGADTLVNLERLQFSDKGVAFDLGTGDAAVNTVRVIGAAFDTPAIVQHPDWVGIGLSLFDSGMSMLEVCALVVSLMGLSNTDFVTSVYTNVVGATPSDTARDYYVGLLQGSGGTMTQAQLLVLAANAGVNATNIDLVGLQETGVEYT